MLQNVDKAIGSLEKLMTQVNSTERRTRNKQNPQFTLENLHFTVKHELFIPNITN